MKTITVKLCRDHDRTHFSCEEELLDKYLKRQASQDMKRGLSVCYVLLGSNNEVLGYYTLSSNNISVEDFPAELAKKLPLAYRELPAVLIGRLAMDKTQKGKGYGEALLVDALRRIGDIAERNGVVAVIVDAMSDMAASFYAKYGFQAIPSGRRMVLPMQTIKKAMPEIFVFEPE